MYFMRLLAELNYSTALCSLRLLFFALVDDRSILWNYTACRMCKLLIRFHSNVLLFIYFGTAFLVGMTFSEYVSINGQKCKVMEVHF